MPFHIKAPICKNLSQPPHFQRVWNETQQLITLQIGPLSVDHYIIGYELLFLQQMNIFLLTCMKIQCTVLFKTQSVRNYAVCFISSPVYNKS